MYVYIFLYILPHCNARHSLKYSLYKTCLALCRTGKVSLCRLTARRCPPADPGPGLAPVPAVLCRQLKCTMLEPPFVFLGAK